MMGRKELCTGFWWGNLKEQDHLEDLGIDGRIISAWILKKYVVWWDGKDSIHLAQLEMSIALFCTW